VPEALLTGRVLDDSVERDVLANHDLSHFGSPFIGLLRVAFVEASAATKTERRISSRPDVTIVMRVKGRIYARMRA
jgi:hypothetical protein